MLHFVRLVHAWAGVVLALLLAILGVSGALLVFKDDYVRASVAQARGDVSLESEALGGALERITAGARLDYVVLARPGFAIHQAGYSDGRQAYFTADGVLIARWNEGERFEQWMFDLHHHLLAGEAGTIVTGVAGIAAALMALTGLVIWAPAARSFAWRIWPRSGARSALLAQHRDLGVLFALPLLVLALTGAGMVFPELARSALHALTASTQTPAPPPPNSCAGEVDWTRAIASAQAAYPDAAPRIVVLPSDVSAPVTIRMRRAEEWHPNGRTLVHIDRGASTVLLTRDAQQFSPGERAFNALYPIHSAAIGGRVYDLVVAASGVAVAALSLLGAWTFLTKTRHRRGARRRLP